MNMKGSIAESRGAFYHVNESVEFEEVRKGLKSELGHDDYVGESKEFESDGEKKYRQCNDRCSSNCLKTVFVLIGTRGRVFVLLSIVRM